MIDYKSLFDMVNSYGFASNTLKKEEPKEKKKQDDGYTKAQGLLLTWIVEEVELFDKISEYVSPIHFGEGFYRDVATRIFEKIKQGDFNFSNICDDYTDDIEKQKLLSKILNTNLGTNLSDDEKKKAITESILKIRQASLDEKSKNAKGIASITQQKETPLDGQDVTTEKDQQKRTVAMGRETKEGMLKSMGESSKGIDGSEKNASANTGTKSTELEDTAEAVKDKNDVSSNAENAKNSADSAEEMTQPEGANKNPSAKEGTDQLVREKNKGAEDMQINAIDVLTSCATVGVVGWAAVVLWPMFLALRWAEQKRKQIRERGYASKK